MKTPSGRIGAIAAVGVAVFLTLGWWLRRTSPAAVGTAPSAPRGDTTGSFSEAIAAMSGGVDTVSDPERIVGTWARLFGPDSIAGCRLQFDGRRGAQARFALSCNRGAPSYNSGAAEGEIPLRGDTAIYRDSAQAGSCEIRFVFGDSGVKVTQEESEVGCGFGYGVSAEGDYQLLRAGPPKWEVDSNPR